MSLLFRRLLRIFIVSFILCCAIGQFAYASMPMQAARAFQLHAELKDQQTLLLHFSIEPGYYLFAKRIQVTAKDPSQVSLGRLLLPKAMIKTYAHLGEFKVFQDKLTVGVPIAYHQQPIVQLHLLFQGCSSAGYCYAPQNRLLEIHFTSKRVAVLSNVARVAPVITQQQPQHQSIVERFLHVTSQLGRHSKLLTLIAFFIMGILVALTPCVWPMIPVLLGILLGAKHQPRNRRIVLVLCYILGMAIAYAAIGFLFAFLGYTITAWTQSPIVVLIFGCLFVLMAMAIFFKLHIRMPEKFKHISSVMSRRARVGTVPGVILIGFVSSIVLSPCATPTFIAALGFVSQHGELWLGTAALFLMALGMGVPLLVVGLGFRWIPKSGMWMEVIQKIIALLLLLVAIVLFARVFSYGIIVMCIAIWMTLIAYFCNAFTSIKGMGAYILKLVGIVLFAAAVILVCGEVAVQGYKGWPLPSGLVCQRKQPVEFESVTSINQLQQKLSIAKENHHPVLLYFSAKWCLSCQEMKHFIFTDVNVKKHLVPFNLLKVDISYPDQAISNMMATYGIIAPPSIIIFDKKGRIARYKVGMVDAKAFIAMLDQVKVNKIIKRQ